MLGVDLDAVAGVANRRHPPARPDRHGRAGLGLGAQHALDEHLRHAVRQLGRAPRAGQRLDHLARRPRRRQAEARQLMLGVAGEIGDVGRIVRRQALRAHLLGKAEPPVVLHGAGLGGVGRREPRRRGLFLQQNGRNAAAAELDGEHQPARPAADDDDRARAGGMASPRVVALIASGLPTANPALQQRLGDERRQQPLLEAEPARRIGLGRQHHLLFAVAAEPLDRCRCSSSDGRGRCSCRRSMSMMRS